MGYVEELNSVLDKYGMSAEGQAEVRRIFAKVRKDAERQGFSEGWNEGQSLCDLDR